MYKNLSLEALGIEGWQSEFVELTLSHGFKGLDLDLVDFAQQAKALGLERAARRITSARLKVSSFRLPISLGDDAAASQAEVEQLATIAEQLNCTRATALVEPGDHRRVYHENFEYYRKRIDALAAALATRKIRLGLGFLAPVACRADYAYQFMQTTDEILLLLSSLGAANVGLAIDTWHWHLGGGTVERIKSLAPEKIASVTLCDAAADATRESAQLSGRVLPVETGPFDQAAVVAALAAMRYDGPVSVAADKSQFGNAGREQIVKTAAAALDRVWKSANPTAASKPAVAAGR